MTFPDGASDLLGKEFRQLTGIIRLSFKTAKVYACTLQRIMLYR